MGCNINPTPLDNIMEGKYYQILNTDAYSRYKGLPFKIFAINMPFILTNIGILDLRNIDLIDTSEQFLKTFLNKQDDYTIPPPVQDEMMISPFSS